LRRNYVKMKQNESDFQKAMDLFGQKKYREALACLEAGIFNYRESPEYFYHAGLAALYVNDQEAATTYLKRAEQLSEHDDPDLQNALALLTLRRGEVPEALAKYLAIIDLEPKNRLAQLGIKTIRAGIAQKRELFWADPSFSARLLPDAKKARRPFPFRPIALGLGICVLLGGLVALAIFAIPRLNQGIRGMGLSAKAQTALNSVSHSASADVRKAKRLLIQGRDNEAIKLCNSVIYANDASAYDKDIARQLRDISQAPKLTDSFYNPSFIDPMREQLLYEGCFIKLRGKATNIVSSKAGVSFDFLIGYQDGKKLDGIIAVRGESELNPSEEFSYDMLAQVRIVDGSPMLTCLALHNLSYSKN
jgi:tetratricopeptide (TPR) repeat protein